MTKRIHHAFDYQHRYGGNWAFAEAITAKVIALNSKTALTERERNAVIALQEIARQLLAQTEQYEQQEHQERKDRNN